MAQQRYCGIPCIMEELGPEPWLLDNFVPEEPIVILYSIPGKGHFVWADFCLIVIWVFCERISLYQIKKRKKEKRPVAGWCVSWQSCRCIVFLLLFILALLCNHSDTGNWIFLWVCSMFSVHNVLKLSDGYLSVFRLLVYVGKSWKQPSIGMGPES